jgi:hypothetical protein
VEKCAYRFNLHPVFWCIFEVHVEGVKLSP